MRLGVEAVDESRELLRIVVAQRGAAERGEVVLAVAAVRPRLLRPAAAVRDDGQARARALGHGLAKGLAVVAAVQAAVARAQEARRGGGRDVV